MDQELFVARMKEARERKKMTLKELADACGVSISAMNRYAAYAAQPGVEVVWQMAKVLGVSMDWLCGQEEKPLQPSMGTVMRAMSLLLTTEIETSAMGKPVMAADFFLQHYSDESVGYCLIVTPDNLNDMIDFDTWRKLLDLYKAKDIDREVYSAWVEKKTRQMDCFLLPFTSD